MSDNSFPTPDVPAIGMVHELWRQDDNGNQVLVATYGRREEAESARDAFEARAHKQIYWVTSRPAEDGG